ncbi:hypothetical protein FKM82_030752 [Ascaphus truei]
MAWPATCLLRSLQLAETPRVGPGELENKPGGPAGPQQGGRGVQVTGAAQLSAAPDRARVRVQVTSNKGTAAEAKDSVQRRLEYIAQSLRQSGVRSQASSPSARAHPTHDTQQHTHTHNTHLIFASLISSLPFRPSFLPQLFSSLPSRISPPPSHRAP